MTAAVIEQDAFARAYGTRNRPGFSIEPEVIAWEAVAFRVRGERDAIVCAPRASLHEFIDRLDDGALDDAINAFLASPPCGRVLRASDQTQRPGLFDELASRAAVTSDERLPAAPGLGLGTFGGGGSPVDARRNKDRRPDRPRIPRRVLVGGAVATVAAVAAVAVVASGGDDSSSVSAGGTPNVVEVTIPGVALPQSPPQPAGEPLSSGAVSGFWTGDWGDLVLRVSDGGRVVATYAHDQGMIVGTLSGRRITGWWCEVPSRKGPGDAGPVQFDFVGEPGQALAIDGRWLYASGATSGATWSEDWDIDAKSQTPPPQALVDRLDDVESECTAGV